MPQPPPKRRKRPGQGAPESSKHDNSGAGIKRKPTGAQAAKLVADPRFSRRARILIERFGRGRVLCELLAQLAVRHDCQAEIETFIDRAVENQSAIEVFGLDELPLPLRAVTR